MNLTEAVKRWPTPTAGDSRSSGSRNTPGSNAHAGVSLTDAVLTGSSTGRDESSAQAGQLNPTWVESYLMDWPIGWTDCEPLETARFHEWQLRHFNFCGPAEVGSPSLRSFTDPENTDDDYGPNLTA